MKAVADTLAVARSNLIAGLMFSDTPALGFLTL